MLDLVTEQNSGGHHLSVVLFEILVFVQPFFFLQPLEPYLRSFLIHHSPPPYQGVGWGPSLLFPKRSLAEPVTRSTLLQPLGQKAHCADAWTGAERCLATLVLSRGERQPRPAE